MNEEIYMALGGLLAYIGALGFPTALCVNIILLWSNPQLKLLLPMEISRY